MGFKRLTEGDVYNCRVGYGVERGELGGGRDWTVEEHLAVDDRLRCGCGRDLFRPEVRREEVALVSSKVVVDGETSLTKEYVCRVR